MVSLIMITGSTIFAVSITKSSKEKKEEKVSYETFSAWTDIEEFQKVPTMTGENVKIGEATNYGGANNMIEVDGANVDEYKAYLRTLEKAGFKKHSDNGENGMDGYACTAAYQKDDLTVVVSHVIKGDKTYISAMKDVELSDSMIYSDDWKANAKEGAKTKLHLLELNNNGTCIIIQLKNGNFLMFDGGTPDDTPYLLDYLEELTPGDEIPVVEGWFITHPHGDHYGSLQEIANKSSYLKRIYVNEIYYHEVAVETLEKNDQYGGTAVQANDLLSKIHGLYKTKDGETAKGFYPQLGQKFYYCDVEVDITLTTDQMSTTTSNWDENDTSTWYMINVEGQKVLFGGDAYVGSQRTLLNMYDKDYLTVDVFVVCHHGMNVFSFFNDYLTVKTVLYPSFNVGSIYTNRYPHFAREKENAELQEKAQEVYAVDSGTVILTFPYEVGSVEKTAPCDWRYNGGIPKGRYTTNWGWDWLAK